MLCRENDLVEEDAGRASSGSPAMVDAISSARGSTSASGSASQARPIAAARRPSMSCGINQPGGGLLSGGPASEALEGVLRRIRERLQECLEARQTGVGVNAMDKNDAPHGWGR